MSAAPSDPDAPRDHAEADTTPPPKIWVGRDGGLRFRRHGHGWLWLSDAYPQLLTASWPVFLLVLFVGWLVANAVFAGAYRACGDCIAAPDPESWLQAFSFSVQTMSSIGYGAMHPTSPLAHTLSNLEAFVGMIMMAMGTGLMFAKFSRPTARIVFSERMILCRFDGQPTLAVRLANRRGNRIVEAQVRAVMLREETTREGYKMRRLIDLPLVRDRSPTFALSWTVMHAVDGDSPFAGLRPGERPAGLVGVILTVSGLDETYGQTVHAQRVLRPEDLTWNHRFADMLWADEDGVMSLDLRRIDALEPVDADHALACT